MPGNYCELIGRVSATPKRLDAKRSRLLLRVRYDYFYVTFAHSDDLPCVLQIGDRVRVRGRLEILRSDNANNDPKYLTAVRAVEIARSTTSGRWVERLRSLPCPEPMRWGIPTGVS
jgi:hypothetical protein